MLRVLGAAVPTARTCAVLPSCGMVVKETVLFAAISLTFALSAKVAK